VGVVQKSVHGKNRDGVISKMNRGKTVMKFNAKVLLIAGAAILFLIAVIFALSRVFNIANVVSGGG
jgi:hypothetical protein